MTRTKHSITRQLDILTEVRKKIYTGEWLPGDSLPSRRWFATEFGVAAMTVQRAFDTLKKDGLVETVDRTNTIVARQLPFRERFAFVLYNDPGAPIPYLLALEEAIKYAKKKRGLDLRVYYALDREDIHQPYFDDLLYGVQNDLFAGVFFASIPQKLGSTDIVQKDGVQRLMFSNHPLEGIPRLDLDMDVFLQKSVAYLAASGSRNPAVLLPSSEGQHDDVAQERIVALFAEHKIEVMPEFIQHVRPTVGGREGVDVARLLLARRDPLPPDSILCLTDDFLPQVVQAINESAQGPYASSPSVVSYANFPVIKEQAYPVKYFGCNVLDMVDRTLSLLEKGKMKTDEVVAVMPICEDTEFSGYLEAY